MSKRPSVPSDQSPGTLELATGNFQPPSMRRLVALVYEFGLLLIITLTVICVSPLAVDPTAKLQPLSLLGMVIPTDFLMLPAVHAVLKTLTLIAIGAWVLKRATRWIYVVTPTISLTSLQWRWYCWVPPDSVEVDQLKNRPQTTPTRTQLPSIRFPAGASCCWSTTLGSAIRFRASANCITVAWLGATDRH